MRLQRFGRLADGLALALCLVGCMDVNADIRVKSPSEAAAILTETISAQFYPLLKASLASSGDAAVGGLCEGNEGGKLTENADGSATCTISKDGKFADLSFINGTEAVAFTAPAPGLVRVALPGAELTAGVKKAAGNAGHGGIPAEDANAQGAETQMKQQMLTYFAGHYLTITIEGGEITDTNMTLAGDRRSASKKIPFVDLINGTARLPAEIYAVVRLD